MVKCFDGQRCPDREGCLRWTAPVEELQRYDNYYRQRGHWRVACRYFTPLAKDADGRRAEVAAA